MGVLCGLSIFIGGVKLINAKADGMPYIDYGTERVYYTETSIQTPNGTSFEARYILNDVSDEKKQKENQANETFVQAGAMLIGAPTAKYNCHSYAWYSQDIATNRYTFGSINAYLDDGSYMEVFNVQPGDIVC